MTIIKTIIEFFKRKIEYRDSIEPYITFKEYYKCRDAIHETLLNIGFKLVRDTKFTIPECYDSFDYMYYRHKNNIVTEVLLRFDHNYVTYRIVSRRVDGKEWFYSKVFITNFSLIFNHIKYNENKLR